MHFVNKSIAILGSGEEGKDLLVWLKRNSHSCRIKVFDQINTVNLTGFDLVFRSPGFWRLHSMFKKAEAKGITISSATKLFFQTCPCPIIGVTGTKGKGTTTTLIYKLLQSQGKNAFIAGNIGKPMLQLLPKLKPSDWVCLELSSFQLQDMTQSPHIAVVLNITRDHLDIHKNIKEYRQAKTNIIKYQTSNDLAVINADYSVTRSMAALTAAKIHWFSRKNLKLDPTKIQLRGRHNLENISAAMTTAALVGVTPKNILKTVYGFKGLEHRLELVRQVKGVKFYNDSFSTTPETAIAAIKSFTEPEVLILGGSDKKSDYRKLAHTIINRSNIKAVILIGQMGPVIRQYLTGYNGLIIKGSSTMPEIVDQACQIAKLGDVVILSPACASFDLFKNYKDRGHQFKTYVNQLH